MASGQEGAEVGVCAGEDVGLVGVCEGGVEAGALGVPARAAGEVHKSRPRQRPGMAIFGVED